MTNLPHVIAGQTRVSEEHIRVLEAWWCEHNDGPLPAGMRLSAANYNAAVDWWNGLPAQAHLTIDNSAEGRFTTPRGPAYAFGKEGTDGSERVPGEAAG